MFTGTVDARKRLLMKETFQPLFICDSLRGFHHQLVMIGGHVVLIIDWRNLMLCRSHLVMLSLCGDTQLPEFFIKLAHEAKDSFRNRSEIVVIHFLSFWRHGAK